MKNGFANTPNLDLTGIAGLAETEARNRRGRDDRGWRLGARVDATPGMALSLGGGHSPVAQEPAGPVADPCFWQEQGMAP